MRAHPEDDEKHWEDRLWSFALGVCTLIVIGAFFLLGVRVGMQVQFDRHACEKLAKDAH